MEGDPKQLKRDTLPDVEAAQQWLEYYGLADEQQDVDDTPPTTYADLSKDVWSVIIGYLTVHDILWLSKLSRAFRELAQSAQIWNAIFVREFGQETLKRIKETMPDAKARVFAWRLKTFFLDDNDGGQYEFVSADDKTKKIYIYFEQNYVAIAIEWKPCEEIAQKFQTADNDFEITNYENGCTMTKTFPTKATKDRAQYRVVYIIFENNFYPEFLPARKKLLKNKICAYCAQPAEELRCSACKSVFYCNAACQENDWARHKRECV